MPRCFALSVFRSVLLVCGAALVLAPAQLTSAAPLEGLPAIAEVVLEVPEHSRGAKSFDLRALTGAPDGGRWSIVGDAPRGVRIHSRTGKLTLRSAARLDYETSPCVRLSVLRQGAIETGSALEQFVEDLQQSGLEKDVSRRMAGVDAVYSIVLQITDVPEAPRVVVPEFVVKPAVEGVDVPLLAVVIDPDGDALPVSTGPRESARPTSVRRLPVVAMDSAGLTDESSTLVFGPVDPLPRPVAEVGSATGVPESAESKVLRELDDSALSEDLAEVSGSAVPVRAKTLQLETKREDAGVASSVLPGSGPSAVAARKVQAPSEAVTLDGPGVLKGLALRMGILLALCGAVLAAGTAWRSYRSEEKASEAVVDLAEAEAAESKPRRHRSIEAPGRSLREQFPHMLEVANRVARSQRSRYVLKSQRRQYYTAAAGTLVACCGALAVSKLGTLNLAEGIMMAVAVAAIPCTALWVHVSLRSLRAAIVPAASVEIEQEYDLDDE